MVNLNRAKIIFPGCYAQRDRLNKKLEKVNTLDVIDKISTTFARIEESHAPGFIHPILPEELLLLLSFVLLKPLSYRKKHMTSASFIDWINKIKTYEGSIKKVEYDMYSIFARAYHQPQLLMQRCTINSALTSIEWQGDFFTKNTELSNKFHETYKLSITDFVHIFIKFLRLSSDETKKLFKSKDVRTLLDEDNQKTEYFLNIISLDVKNARKV